MRSSRSAPDRPSRGVDPLDPGAAGFSHRGLHGPGVPENSLAAIAASVAAGAGMECDLRLCADGAVVVFHDRDLRRLCGVEGDVEALTAEVVVGHRLLGTDEAVPHLVAMLDVVDCRVPILLELKTRAGNAERFAAAVASEIEAYRGAVGVMSFDPRVAAWLARHRPDVRRGLVLSGRDGPFGRWWKMTRARPHFLAVKTSEVACRWVQRARLDMPVYAWTVRTAEGRAATAPLADALIWEADGRPRA